MKDEGSIEGETKRRAKRSIVVERNDSFDWIKQFRRQEERKAGTSGIFAYLAGWLYRVQ
jgi:hypothetical protein